MLIGREPECRRIDEVLSSAESGRGTSLLLLGEAGIGKTALLDYAAARADERELRNRPPLWQPAPPPDIGGLARKGLGG